MPDVFDALPAAPATGGDVFDQIQQPSAVSTAPRDIFDALPPEASKPATPEPGFVSNAWQDIKQTWQRTAGQLAQAVTRPPNVSYAGVPPLPPGMNGNNPPSVQTSAQSIASGQAAPAFYAGQDLAQSAAEDHPLPSAYQNSFGHTVVSTATAAVPAVATAVANPMAGAVVGAGQMSEALRQTAIDAGHPDKADDAATWGAALGMLTALPFGHIVDGLKFGNPVVQQSVQALAAGASEASLRPIAAGALKAGGTGALVGAAGTVGTNEALRSTGIDPNRALTQGIVGNMAAGGILGVVGGAVAGKLGFDAEQTNWETLARAYAEEVPSKPVLDAVQAYGQDRTPGNLATVLHEANKTFADLEPRDQATVLQNLGIKLGVITPPDQTAPMRNLTPDAPETSPSAAAGAPVQPGADTTIFGSKGTEFPAQYAWAPTPAIQTSHSGQMMADNPNYLLTNTRDYSDPAERDKQLDVLQNFDPRRHVTDSPDAAVGPSIVGTVIDQNGNASLQRFGGNNRGYAIANLDPFDRAQLNQVQNAKAAQFGLAPTADPNAELVRHIGTFDFRQPGEQARAQAIVDALNPSPGMIQGTAKRAEIDAAAVPPDLLKTVPMDIAPKDAQQFVQGLIGQGLADRNLTSAIAASPAQAQDYTQRLLVNAAFQQPTVAEARSDPRASASAVRGMIDAAVPALVQMRSQPGGAPIADAVSNAFTTTLGYLGKDGAGLPEALTRTAAQNEIDPNHAVAQQIAQVMHGALVTDKAGRIRTAESTANLQTLFGRIAGALAHFNPEPDIFGAQETPHQVIQRALQSSPVSAPQASPVTTPAAVSPPSMQPAQALGDNGGAPALARPGSPLPASRQLDMQMEGRGNVSIPQVLKSFENILHSLGENVPIRFGRFFNKALGIYKPGARVARIGNAGNLATAAHEIAHAMQHAAFGDFNSGVLNARLPAVASADLHRLGVALYGQKMPHNGFESEGWAELWRHYLTGDDVKQVAPAAWDYVTKTFLPQYPKLQKAVEQAKALADLWRSQGAVNRARAQMVHAPGPLARLRQTLSGLFTSENWIEQFTPLKELADEYKAQTGKTLSPASNPYEVASARRGTSGAVTLQMVMHGMIDLHGNLATDATGRTIGSLREIVRPLRGLEEEFAHYLWAQRALELHARQQDPGMSLADAQHLSTTLGDAHPELGPAAQQLYAWQSAVLDYLAQAAPALKESIERMKATNLFYIPLQRFLMKQGAASADARTGLAGGALSRLKGSGRQVKAILDQVVSNTQALVLMAHKAQILQTIVQVSRAPGMGHLIEEVPRDRVRETVDMDAIRSQLEALGLDTSAEANARNYAEGRGINYDELTPEQQDDLATLTGKAGEGETLDFWTLADRPKGSDNIIPVRDAVSGTTKWFQVSPELFDLMNGLQPPQLGPLGEWLAGKWARGFRLATTGVRPSFQLVTLPARQLPMLMLQTMSSDNPGRVFLEYMHGAGDAVRSGLLGQHTPYGNLFHQLAVEAGQPMGRDQQFTRQAVQGLFRGKVLNTVRSPLEAFRSLINFMDRAPRIAEMRMVADRIGWAPGTPLTPDQAIALANAGKRGGAVDYSAGGRLSQYFNQMIPFFNPAIQHVRTMARVAVTRPWAFMAKVFAMAVLPALALWWKNKDEKWYQDLPWRERYLNDNFSPDGVNVVQIPRPQEWSIFPALAEGMANAMYRHEPESLKQAVSYSVAENTPGVLPVLARWAWEQARNETSFFNQRIVPRNQEDMMPGDQSSPYNSELARALGRAFPDKLSPARIDATIKSVFGGIGGDTLQAGDALVHALGIGTPEGLAREKEASDFPVLGRLFRRGGVSTRNNQELSDFYDLYTRLEAQNKSKVDPISAVDKVYLMQLTATEHRMKMLETVANVTSDLGARQRLYESLADMVRAALANQPKASR